MLLSADITRSESEDRGLANVFFDPLSTEKRPCVCRLHQKMMKVTLAVFCCRPRLSWLFFFCLWKGPLTSIDSRRDTCIINILSHHRLFPWSLVKVFRALCKSFRRVKLLVHVIEAVTFEPGPSQGFCGDTDKRLFCLRSAPIGSVTGGSARGSMLFDILVSGTATLTRTSRPRF